MVVVYMITVGNEKELSAQTESKKVKLMNIKALLIVGEGWEKNDRNE